MFGLTGGLDAMSAQLLAHPGVSNVGVEGLDHQLLLDARDGVHLLGEALDELGERLGDKDALVGSGVPLLVLGRGDLVLGFVLLGNPDPLLYVGAAIRKLPELAGGLNAMSAQLLAHPGVSNIGVEGLDHQLLLDAGDGVHLLGEELDELAESFTRKQIGRASCRERVCQYV